MEDIKPIDAETRVSQPLAINSAQFTLQSLCCKVLLMKEESNLSINKEEKLFHNKIHEENNFSNTNLLSNSLEADRISKEVNFTPEMVISENLDVNLNANTEEWIDINELDKFIHELKEINPFPNLENDFPEFEERYDDFGKVKVGDTPTKSKIKKDFVSYSRRDSDNGILNKIKAESNDKGITILSSSDDSDFEFSLPDDIDEISLSSLEAYENSIENNKLSKVTIEISPKIQFITNFNDAKETCQDSNILQSSSSAKHDTEDNEKLSNISLNEQDLNDSFCSGYNSADFEFITEDEAKTDGFIINYKKTKEVFNNETCRTVEVNGSSANSSQSSQISNNDTDYRNNYEIPEGDNFVDLFRGIYAPTIQCFYENKCMGSMNLEYAGVGFDIGVLSRQIREYQPDDEYKEEAEECAKKILNMYPRENRKRRRRFF